MLNIPFDDATAQAEALVLRGAIVHQKFTCSACGSRQTMERPNTFYTFGDCEECRHTTNLLQTGCGYAVILGARGGRSKQPH